MTRISEATRLKVAELIARGFTQQEVARQTGVPPGSIDRLVRQTAIGRGRRAKTAVEIAAHKALDAKLAARRAQVARERRG